MVRPEEEEQKSLQMYERGFLMLRTVIGERRDATVRNHMYLLFAVHKS